MNYILIRAAAILVTSYITGIGVTLSVTWQTAVTATLVALALAVINHTIKPIISIVSVPINIVTLGFFSLVINGLMILLAGAIVPGFLIPSFIMAVWFSIVLTIVNWLLNAFE